MANTPNTPSSDATANLTDIPTERIMWIKNPLITQIKFAFVKEESNLLSIYYRGKIINPSNKPAQYTSMPTPDGDPLRIRSEGKDIHRIPEPESPVKRVVAPPNEGTIRRSTDMIEPGYSGEGGNMPIDINYYQLLPGTHIYEVTEWQTQLNWLDVKKILSETLDKGKGQYRYPMTDNAPSNRLYFKVYVPTEAEAKQGKKMKFLGEVDAKTQVPQFPFARPGDFAHKTGYWRPVGSNLPSAPEVFVKEGDSMPNFPGEVGVDPFSFKWQFVREGSVK